MTRRWPSSGSELAAGVLAVAIAVVASGCWPWPQRARGEQLRESARSLLPPSSSVVLEEAGDCVELAPSPSCVHVYFVAEPAPLPDRVGAVEERAAAAGWELEQKEVLAGGANLRLRRSGLAAVVYIWREDRAGPCREAPRKDCADVIMVERRG